MKAPLFAAALYAFAPYQCGTEPNERPVEDTPPQALWTLAERFGADGDVAARETTLRQIIEEYPSSRYAQRARQELGIAEPQPSAP